MRVFKYRNIKLIKQYNKANFVTHSGTFHVDDVISTIFLSKIFKKIQNEYGTFHNYLKTFTNDVIIYEIDKTTNKLSDNLSKDLQKNGMKFVGSTIIYSYLQAIGIIYSHDKECFMYKNN